jgi:hypothetical protein
VGGKGVGFFIPWIDNPMRAANDPFIRYCAMKKGGESHEHLTQ